jgi:hypothetical protein
MSFDSFDFCKLEFDIESYHILINPETRTSVKGSPGQQDLEHVAVAGDLVEADRNALHDVLLALPAEDKLGPVLRIIVGKAFG